MKAKFIGKIYDKKCVILQYEYKGHKYDVCDYGVNGPDYPLWKQHKEAQEQIDKHIEDEAKPKTGNPVDLDEIWNMLGWLDELV